MRNQSLQITITLWREKNYKNILSIGSYSFKKNYKNKEVGTKTYRPEVGVKTGCNVNIYIYIYIYIVHADEYANIWYF